jgi:predicted dehydrogenase
MNEPFRWGILGAAKIARTAVAPAIHAAAGSRLVALATRDPDRAGPFRTLVQNLRIHAGYDALLADPGVDAVYIPLPNHLHVDWCARALAAGKHVLCEKPMAMVAADFDRLQAAQAASGRLLAEAFMILHHPQWHRARDLIADGAIGALQHVEGVFTYRNTDPANIRNRPETGGGALRDIGCYPLAVTRFVTGAEPVALEARAVLEGGVDTHARARAVFPDFELDFRVSMRMALRQEMVFHGTGGWLRATAPFNTTGYGDTRLELRRHAGDWQVDSFNAPDQYRLMIEAFAPAARGDAPAQVPLAFSRGNQAALDALLASAGVTP